MTRLLCAAALLLAAVLTPGLGLDARGQDALTPRFTSVDLIIDPNGAPLAVYQIEFAAPLPDGGSAVIVGIEEGDAAAFGDALHFDPRAMRGNRVVLADFSLASAADLPAEPVRVATLHLMVQTDAEPDYTFQLTAAADAEGLPIDADLNIHTGEDR